MDSLSRLIEDIGDRDDGLMIQSLVYLWLKPKLMSKVFLYLNLYILIRHNFFNGINSFVPYKNNGDDNNKSYQTLVQTFTLIYYFHLLQKK